MNISIIEMLQLTVSISVLCVALWCGLVVTGSAYQGITAEGVFVSAVLMAPHTPMRV